MEAASCTAWTGSSAVHADGARAMRMLRCEAELAIQVRAGAATDGDPGAKLGEAAYKRDPTSRDLSSSSCLVQIFVFDCSSLLSEGFAQGVELGDWA
ncbi:hypothetical protein Taro_019715 [Colocasia esculenta]|uniref:Uncharacterized protein n=1 Tax=Colocasia esculenta TaxID=4460 RepID=A0A843V6B9_COLES|nr:hypothetical protein [Colocasia esculenta]